MIDHEKMKEIAKLLKGTWVPNSDPTWGFGKMVLETSEILHVEYFNGRYVFRGGWDRLEDGFYPQPSLSVPLPCTTVSETRKVDAIAKQVRTRILDEGRKWFDACASQIASHIDYQGKMDKTKAVLSKHGVSFSVHSKERGWHEHVRSIDVHGDSVRLDCHISVESTVKILDLLTAEAEGKEQPPTMLYALQEIEALCTPGETDCEYIGDELMEEVRTIARNALGEETTCV